MNGLFINVEGIGIHSEVHTIPHDGARLYKHVNYDYNMRTFCFSIHFFGSL